MRTLFILFCITMILPGCKSTHMEEQTSIKVLIIDGFSNHDWRATTRALLKILEKDDDIIAEVSTVPEEGTDAWVSWLPSFSAYDVIIQNTNDINNKRSWPVPAKDAFEKYMSEGGGMLVHHSANNAFATWSEYNKMIGLGWRNKNFGPAIIVKDGNVVRIPSGQGENTGHGKRVDALITRLEDHPIHAGLPQQWLAIDLEVYRYARGPAENIKILSYARDSKSGLNFPIEWVVEYEKGLVYNSTYGHYWHDLDVDPPGIRCVAFQTIFMRAIRWLARADIPSDLPEEFPSR